MTLHIFNPDHDLALASGLENFTAPHAGRQLRHDLGWLPVLWAKPDDIVLVDNEEEAKRALKRISGKLAVKPQATFAAADSIPHDLAEISPWGWNAALRHQLLRWGVNADLLPAKNAMVCMRELSHRRTSAQLLKCLTAKERTVGTVLEITTWEDLHNYISHNGKVVLKAPWSSSGRGVRFVEGQLTASMEGWVKNILNSQVSVMAEPYYNKVKDFGMEFEALPDGTIRYIGLSLFHTMNGAYTGNILATEERKQEMMSHYLQQPLLEEIRNAICKELSPVFKGKYAGPFGIDMMIVAAEDGFMLHPCVEINLRRTMGHVALALTRLVNPRNDSGITRVMRIEYESNQYRIKLQFT